MLSSDCRLNISIIFNKTKGSGIYFTEKSKIIDFIVLKSIIVWSISFLSIYLYF